MSLSQPVKRKLIFFTSIPFQFTAYLVIQMKRIAQDRKLDVVLMDKL